MLPVGSLRQHCGWPRSCSTASCRAARTRTWSPGDPWRCCSTSRRTCGKTWAATRGCRWRLQDAYSGGRCLTLAVPAGGEATAAPPWLQQFGHTIRNWDFEIVENPQPGQYRYLQFAWKAAVARDQGDHAAAGREPLRRLRLRRRGTRRVGGSDDREAGRRAACRVAGRAGGSLGGGQETLAHPQPDR